uniref:G-protein coupled receptors family 1 profile domain-containing protein n=1 Tax=Chelydra serpentina TaxID=8475 RepID=A0A8C3SCL4_CHESE
TTRSPVELYRLIDLFGHKLSWVKTSLFQMHVLITVLRNALFIRTFVVDKNLRQRSNYFFFNLAILGFEVEAFCIPVYLSYALTDKWIFGRGLYKLRQVVAHLMCTASAFHINLNSYDMSLSVTKAVHIVYAVTSVSLNWDFASIPHDDPAICIWEHVAGCSIVTDGKCYTEYYLNWSFHLPGQNCPATKILQLLAVIICGFALFLFEVTFGFCGSIPFGKPNNLITEHCATLNEYVL